MGLSQQVMSNADSLELGFLDFDRRDDSSHLFFETPQTMLRLPERAAPDRRCARPELLRSLPRGPA